ncbi:MAG: ABC transporter permease [Bacteroidales bacterium]|nr:ABC transporter permease [Bacteroidales bacterium]
MSRNLHSAFQSIRQNKIRSVLAGFGIAWGIFLLVFFLGIGNGFKSGVMDLFHGYAQKSLFVYGGRTSIATGAMGENTPILFRKELIERLKARYGVVIACSAEMTRPSVPVVSDGEATTASVKGVSSDYFQIKILDTKAGRALNHMDEMTGRDVAVIGEEVEHALFGSASGLGKKVTIGNELFEIVGILSSEDLLSMQDRRSIYIPTPSYNASFNSEGGINSFCLSLSSDARTTEIEKDLRGYLAWLYGFDPHDDNAVYVANIETQTSSFENLFNGLGILIWIVGICLLLSGIVGVTNVMLIIVKERTNEIGIRKAVGATSASIISMMMTESILITAVAGATGALLGIGLVTLADKLLLPLFNTDIIGHLEIDSMTIVAAMIVLCLCGVIAGLFPALKASQIEPVEAIRYENRG